MNAISVTMVKDPSTKPRHDYAFRLMVTMVTLSWLGWQLLLIGGCYQKQGLTGTAESYVEGGVVLLLYSIYTLLRLKRKELTPTRESAQLFFGAFLAALPLLTWIIWKYMLRLLAIHDEFRRLDDTGRSLLYADIVIGMAYVLMIVLSWKTNMAAYDHAKANTWSYRVMRQLEMLVVKPYARD